MTYKLLGAVLFLFALALDMVIVPAILDWFFPERGDRRAET